MHTTKKPRTGFGYFFYGLSLALTPGIRRFVIMPLLINIIFIGSVLFYLFEHLDGWISGWLSHLPEFFAWVYYVLWPILTFIILATFSYFFSTLANFIASPLNGLLAEKVEVHLTGKPINSDNALDLIKDTPRILAREWRKLRYILPKAIGLFLLLLIPGLGQTLGAILWFAFTSWVLAIQYCDYPFDNHKVPFNTMRHNLKEKQFTTYSFGALVNVFTTIPFLNLIVMPVAVCGATAMWVNEYKQKNVTL